MRSGSRCRRGAGVFAAVARRVELDAAMVDLARRSGATVHEGHGFAGLTHSADGGSVDVEATGLGTVRSRYVIAADGMWSPVRKAARSRRDRLPGRVARLPAVLHQRHRPGCRAALRLVRGGSAPRLRLVVPAARRQRQRRVRRPAWSGAAHPADAATPGPNCPGEPTSPRPSARGAVPEARHLAWPIPARVDRTVLGTDRVLFVGDAARVTDPLTGEGIGQALLTGVLAARAVARAGAGAPDAVRQHYERDVADHLLADHRLSSLLGRALRHDWGARGSVRVAGMTDWTRRNFARWLFEDEPRAIAAHPVSLAPSLPRPRRCLRRAAGSVEHLTALRCVAIRPEHRQAGSLQFAHAHSAHRSPRHRASRDARRHGWRVVSPAGGRGLGCRRDRHVGGLDDAARRARRGDGPGQATDDQAVRRRPAHRAPRPDRTGRPRRHRRRGANLRRRSRRPP